MITLWNMFGKSPFSPLLGHMEKVGQCVALLEPLFELARCKEWEDVVTMSQELDRREHLADLEKNALRNQLPKKLFFSVDRAFFLRLVSQQDQVADVCQEIAFLLSLRSLEFDQKLGALFMECFKTSCRCFHLVEAIYREFHELIETTFGGLEAEKVRGMVEEVARIEHEASGLKKESIQQLYRQSASMESGTFRVWEQLIDCVARIAVESEHIANQVRMALDLR